MLHQMKTGSIVLSIGYLLVGLLLLIVPGASLRWICYAFGAVILATGAVNLFRYFRIRGQGLKAPFLLVGGVVAFGLGLFLLLKPDFVISILPVVFGLFILLDGIIRIANGLELARAKGQKWWLLVLLGLLSVVLGLVVVFHPFDAMVSVAMLCGIMLVVEGALNLGCVIYASMELRTLARLAEAALRTAEEAQEAAARDAIAQAEVVCDAEATEVNTESAPNPDAAHPFERNTP
ncbi:MAG: DUF308 domain-containing protein [Gemmiger sp.]|nr:DUF308 domain-containing protein [Gemmiger sp.]